MTASKAEACDYQKHEIETDFGGESFCMRSGPSVRQQTVAERSHIGLAWYGEQSNSNFLLSTPTLKAEDSREATVRGEQRPKHKASEY